MNYTEVLDKNVSLFLNFNRQNGLGTKQYTSEKNEKGNRIIFNYDGKLVDIDTTMNEQDLMLKSNKLKEYYDGKIYAAGTPPLNQQENSLKYDEGGTQSGLDKRVSEFINALKQNGLADKHYTQNLISNGTCYSFVFIKPLDNKYNQECRAICEVLIKEGVDVNGYINDLLYFYNAEQVTEQVTEQALKYDDGKLDWELLDLRQFENVVEVLKFGEKKYGRNNWRKGHNTIQIYNALQRHLIAYINGEDIDKESGLSHLGHAGACLMFLNYNTNTNLDNRRQDGIE